MERENQIAMLKTLRYGLYSVRSMELVGWNCWCLEVSHLATPLPITLDCSCMHEGMPIPFCPLKLFVLSTIDLLLGRV
jgi:hypothetical protein